MAKRNKRDQVKKESSMNNINQEQERRNFGETMSDTIETNYLEETRERRDGPGGN